MRWPATWGVLRIVRGKYADFQRVRDRSMSLFVSQVSPVTGKTEWVMQNENYDYYQEVARSAYADMLHDTERNKKYNAALVKAIDKLHADGKEAHVLDIGTGTGLLSMMAVRGGADSVTACEAFEPMAKCAKQVIADNGFRDKIKLIFKRSTDVEVGPGKDMARRANILVTEVFDTELIGEGGLHTFKHAHEQLLEKDCVVVPTSANMYVQVVQSDLAWSWHRMQDVTLPDGGRLQAPEDIVTCAGSAGVLDLQLEEFPRDRFQPITDPVRVFQFDFSGGSSINLEGHTIIKRPAKRGGHAHALFMWWDVRMDLEGEVLLSCAPSWAHPHPEERQWRDHWMQAVYFPRNSVQVTEGDSVIIDSYHDDYSLWFDLRIAAKSQQVRVSAPACTGGAHVAYSPSRLGMINDAERMRKYTDVLSRQAAVCKLEDMTVVSVSDGSILPLVLAKLGAKKVYAIETHPNCRRIVEKFAAHNKLGGRVTVLSKHPDDAVEEIEGKVDLVVAEPFFNASSLPWHNVYFWYARTALDARLRTGAPWRVMPRGAGLRAIAVDFTDLWKIRSPVGDCEGFNLRAFDQIIDTASRLVDANVEPQPLWEYPGLPLSDVIPLMDMDFTKPLQDLKKIERAGVAPIKLPGRCSGVALWMDYDLDEVTSLTSGLLAPPQAGHPLRWDMHTRQGVHLFSAPRQVAKGARLKYKLTFSPQNGDFDFKFTIMD